MVKCPFCGFENEDGALFCEQCKSDLSSVPSTPAPEPVPRAAAVDERLSLFPSANEAVAQRADTIPVLNLDDDPRIAETLPHAEAWPLAEALPTASIQYAETLPVAEALPAEEAIPLHIPDALPLLPVAEAILADVIPEPPPTQPLPEATPVETGTDAIPAGSQPRLKVMRGVKVGVEFPIYADYNYIGRADEKPVDVDLEDQEPPDRVWCSRQHAVIHFNEAGGVLTLEDLNSSNGTFVNRTRVYPGEKRELKANDVVQIGTVHLKLLV